MPTQSTLGARTGSQVLAGRLDEAHVPYELIRHRRTETARGEAAVLGVAPWEVAKTVILKTGKGFVRAVLPASKHVDVHKVGRVLDTSYVALASEPELIGAYPEFELGAVPPIGGGRGDQVLIDIALCGLDSVLIEAGAHDRSMRIDTGALIEASDAALADLCAD